MFILGLFFVLASDGLFPAGLLPCHIHNFIKSKMPRYFLVDHVGAIIDKVHSVAVTLTVTLVIEPDRPNQHKLYTVLFN